MKNANNGPAIAAMRYKAGLKAGQQQEPLSARAADPLKLLHELQVHQLELCLQNDELRRIQLELETSRALYFELYDLAPVGYCTLSASGAILQANLVAATLLGVTRQALVEQPISSFIVEADYGIFLDHCNELVVAGVTHSCDLRMVKRDGTPFWACLRSVSLPVGDGLHSYRISLSDITANKQMEEALREQKDFFHQIAENLSDFIAVLDLEGRRIYNSPSYRKLFGTIDELQNSDSFADVHPDDRERVRRVFMETVQTGHGQRIEFRFLMPDGSIRDIESRSSGIRGKDEQVMRVLVVSRDITEHRQLQEQVRHMAFHDALTELPNRRLFCDRLNLAIATNARSACQGALMFLDLDNFKPLNDAFGHDVGDQLLIEASARLKRCVREMDTVARFGGDEFVVMLSTLVPNEAESMAHAVIVAEKLRAVLSELYCLTVGEKTGARATVEHRCTASIGVTLFKGDDLSPSDILKRADATMYQAKQAGGNQVRVLTPAGTLRQISPER